jgi:Zn-dependent M28 family amino/carboxypeptidase
MPQRLAALMMTVAMLGLSVSSACAREPNRPILSGDRALRHVQQLVKWGNRSPGSSGHQWAQAYIIRHLRLAYIDEIQEVDFVARTPQGAKAMKNIIGKIPGKSSEIVVLAGHYDTLQQEGFVGANDGGSSTALLLEFARVLGLKQPPPVTVWITFFDGEEAFEEWSESDGIYGSRYQASAWQRDGTLERIKAVIVVDMIGDKDLRLRQDYNSTPWLTDLIWRIAAEKGYGDHFSQEQTAVEDDHVPFRRAGVPAVDLIDLEYGPDNRHWHTGQDTVEKLSARSFKIVGDVVLEAVARLGQRWPSAPAPSH